VNTFSEAESRVHTEFAETGNGEGLQTATLPALTSWPIWRYLALAALLLFALEWWLFHRRRTE
jgi:hypothetical protein